MSFPALIHELRQSQPDEVRWLLEEKYGWSREEVLSLLQDSTAVQTVLLDKVTDEIRGDLEQLAQGIPVAYLIGWVTFLGCHIDLSHRTLIPRPETEFWVEHCIRTIHARPKTGVEDIPEKPLRVLDLCCGSGCIGIAVLRHLPQVTVDFVDISPQALQQTQLNLERAQVDAQRYRLTQSDLFTAVDGDYDLILCNPPYVDKFGYYSDYVQHEPEIALFAQNSGLSLIERVIFDIKNHLNDQGQVWLEYGEEQATALRHMADSAGLKIEICQDQFGADRYAIITTTASHLQN